MNMRQCPVSLETKRRFNSVVYAMRRYGRNSCGHKMAQREAVLRYLREREVRAYTPGELLR